MNLFDQFDAVLSDQPATCALATAVQGEPISTQEDRKREWLMQRYGKFTASEVHKLMAYPDKDELPKGAISYVLKKAAENLTEFSITQYITDAMQWGMINEPEAIDAFSEATGLIVSKCKDEQEFIDKGHVGGTPDGLILSDFSGVEVKCPNSDTHLVYRQIQTGPDLKAVALEYYWQVHCLMMLTSSQHWYFVSYDPRFKEERLRLHIAKIFADPIDLARLKIRLSLAEAYKVKVIEQTK